LWLSHKNQLQGGEEEIGVVTQEPSPTNPKVATQEPSSESPIVATQEPTIKKPIEGILQEEDVEFSRSYQLSSWSVFDQAKTLSFLLS
jgi:hypothetical protein